MPHLLSSATHDFPGCRIYSMMHNNTESGNFTFYSSNEQSWKIPKDIFLMGIMANVKLFQCQAGHHYMTKP